MHRAITCKEIKRGLRPYDCHLSNNSDQHLVHHQLLRIAFRIKFEKNYSYPQLRNEVNYHSDSPERCGVPFDILPTSGTLLPVKRFAGAQ